MPRPRSDDDGRKETPSIEETQPTLEESIREEPQPTAQVATEDDQQGEGKQVTKERFPHLRRSYPHWVARVLGAVLLGSWLYASYLLKLYEEFWLVAIGAAAIVVFVVFWRIDSNRTLRDRLPPRGWKSEIDPENLENMTPNEFDGMRFELSGSTNDDIADHRVPWASRRSRDIIFISRCLAVLAVLCPVGAVVFPKVSLAGTGAQLPQEYNLVPCWLAAIPLLLVAVWLIRLNWDYSRLLLDLTFLLVLRENPAWLPWLPGKNDPIRISSIYSADPIDTEWGKRWGHGTVKLEVMIDLGPRRTIYLRRVPNHREFCNVLNGLIGGPQFYPSGMMY